jgi:hypothetical protein
MAKGGLKVPKSNAAMIATGIAVVVLIFIVYASFFMVPASSDHRVLLVASDVLAQAGGPAKFATYLSNQSVAVVPYNYDSVATYAELGDLVGAHMASTGATRVRSVGIMYHTFNRFTLKCFKSDPGKSTVSGSPDTFESFRRFIVALRAAYGVEDVDLISCDVVSAETSVLSALDFNGARVNASTNTTGQAAKGAIGDWVLESGEVSLVGRYFNTEITRIDLALAAPPPPGMCYGKGKSAAAVAACLAGTQMVSKYTPPVIKAPTIQAIMAAQRLTQAPARELDVAPKAAPYVYNLKPGCQYGKGIFGECIAKPPGS